MGVSQPSQPGNGRMALVNGAYSVLVKDVGELARIYVLPNAIDAYFDPDVGSGTVRFTSQGAAQYALTILG